MFAAISNSITVQSDSIPLSVLASRQPCTIMSPVAFAVKFALPKEGRISIGSQDKTEILGEGTYPEHGQVSFRLKLKSANLN